MVLTFIFNNWDRFLNTSIVMGMVRGLSRAEVDKAVVELYPYLACGEATKAAAIDKAYEDFNISKVYLVLSFYITY